jgi:hypothetical protein
MPIEMSMVIKKRMQAHNRFFEPLAVFAVISIGFSS